MYEENTNVIPFRPVFVPDWVVADENTNVIPYHGYTIPDPLFKVKLLHPKSKVPTKSYEGDSGWDLYALLPITLNHGTVSVVRTGIAIQPRKGWGWIVKDRSSMALSGVFTHGGVGDNGYRGEISVSMTCEAPQAYIVEGQKFAQIVFHLVPEGGAEVVDELDPSERGEKHWGSSGR